jgi:hypothetical protein
MCEKDFSPATFTCRVNQGGVLFVLAGTQHRGVLVAVRKDQPGECLAENI